jgi:DNA modification methylase
MNLPATLMRSFDELPTLDALNFGEVVSINLSSHTSPYTHGLHRYPAKFIPQIPRWAIGELSAPNEVVLDPFVGSGTTMVEALASGRAGIGVDLDPLACLIAKAKTAKLDASQLRSLQSQLSVAVVRDDEELCVPMEGVKNFEHWFARSAWGTLQNIRNNIMSLECTIDERTFLLCVFSSILRLVSNADDQTQKTYVSGTLKKYPPAVRPTFFRYLDRGIKSVINLGESRSNSAIRIFNESATAMPIESESVDLIVTSPPYLDSVDYMYNMMLEYFWLGDVLGVPSRSDFNSARRRTVGSKTPMKDRSLPGEISNLIDEAALPRYRKDAATSYFADMKEHFAEADRVLRDGRHYVLVIGNSQTERGQLPVHDALVQLAASHNLTMTDAFGYRIRRHYMKFPRKGRGGIILMDWVIVLKKNSGTRRPARRLPLPLFQFSPNQVAN